MNQLKKILIVDDEPNIIRSIKRICRGKGYDIHLADSASQALEIIAKESIQVVVSDQLMPNMTGAELFEKIQNEFPSVIRILLTGHTALEGLTSAVNKGAVFRILFKPWDDDLVLQAIDDAFEYFFVREKNKQLTEELKHLNANLESKVVEKTRELQYLAYYNPLTDLANRALLEVRLEEFLESANRTGKILVLALFDIVSFRDINTTFGRHAGDKVLQQIADRLLSRVTDATRIAHIGIDQFAVIYPEVGTEDLMAVQMRQRIERVFDAPFTVNDAEVVLSIRAGIALFPTDGENSQAMLGNAESALKRAKHSNDQIVFFEQGMTERVAERIALANRLRLAVERDEFILYFQPKYACFNNAIVGAEALIRWQSPDLGMVSPAEFIPALEETGLILNVGEWVIREAARIHQELTQQGIQVPRIAVNVSGLQLNQPDFVKRVKAALQLEGQLSQIDLEITESLIMENIDNNISKLHELNALGVKIAIDDFGTGYSSLSYLSRLPADYLKIDQSFVASMNQDPRAMTLVLTIISLAHSLQMGVIAEGVETEEQARILRLFRCNQKQGSLLSKPLPQEAFTQLLVAQQSEHRTNEIKI